MKATRCDNHPEREAVITLAIRIMPPGSRPMLFGFEAPPRRYFDFCSECVVLISPLIKEEFDART